MKFSLIFILVVQAILSLVQQIFVDSVNFIFHPCNIKNKKTFTTERNSKVTSAVNFIPSKLGKLPQRVLKVVLCTGLNVYRESSGGSRSVTKSLLMCYKWS